MPFIVEELLLLLEVDSQLIFTETQSAQGLGSRRDETFVKYMYQYSTITNWRYFKFLNQFSDLDHLNVPKRLA